MGGWLDEGTGPRAGEFRAGGDVSCDVSETVSAKSMSVSMGSTGI